MFKLQYMRALNKNETKKQRGSMVEYFDELGRNTYYWTPSKWIDKKWLRLSNGEDREIEVISYSGYWRKHFYDIHACQLLKEIDSKGNKNLLDKRRQWNPKDTEISQENIKQETKKSSELF